MNDDMMKDELDGLLSEFARGQLEGQTGKLASNFRSQVIRSRRWRLGWATAGLAAAAVVGVVVGLAMMNGVGGDASGQGNLTGGAQVALGSQISTEDVWYRDVDGGTVVLEDNLPVRVVYRQMWQMNETVDEAANTVLTDIQPVEVVMVIDQPVF